ncbi:MAG: hypothetical protein WCF28_00965 [Methanobacterium sp.]|uniref:hypothetical protein n=1 Tax=Methanobacterium sp. TaxID=2164 RepID=UPI003C790B7B
MRGMLSRGHMHGVYLYQGKNGMILVNDQNKEDIKRDAEELSKEIFGSDWICPQAQFKNAINNKVRKN